MKGTQIYCGTFFLLLMDTASLYLLDQWNSNPISEMIPLGSNTAGVHVFAWLMITRVVILVSGCLYAFHDSYHGVKLFYCFLGVHCAIAVLMTWLFMEMLLGVHRGIEDHVEKTVTDMLETNQTYVCHFWMNVHEQLKCSPPNAICDACSGSLCSGIKPWCTGGLLQRMHISLDMVSLLYVCQLFGVLWMLCNGEGVIEKFYFQMLEDIESLNWMHAFQLDDFDIHHGLSVVEHNRRPENIDWFLEDMFDGESEMITTSQGRVPRDYVLQEVANPVYEEIN